jgi:hypothetical protein
MSNGNPLVKRRKVDLSDEMKKAIAALSEDQKKVRKWCSEPEFTDLERRPFYSFVMPEPEITPGVLCDFCRRWLAPEGFLCLFFFALFVFHFNCFQFYRMGRTGIYWHSP